METVLGRLNGVWLRNKLAESEGRCASIRAAVAYAEYYEPFVDYVSRTRTRLSFYGRIDPTLPIDLRLLEWFLTKAPPGVTCHVINGAFHAKVIWWHGFGAYIGSANLTANGWDRNLECGVFLNEEELVDGGSAEELECFFTKVHEVASALSPEILAGLREVSDERRRTADANRRVDAKYQQIFGNMKPFGGQTRPREDTRNSLIRDEFVREWNQTQTLLRRLIARFEELGCRPKWLPEDVESTAHFDQFLHGYFYHQVCTSNENGRRLDKVNAFHRTNRENPDSALANAAQWWRSLAERPTASEEYDEAEFLTVRAPRMRELFARDRVSTLTEDEFVEAMTNVHAVKEHGRYAKNRHLGLQEGTSLLAGKRVDLHLRWVWRQRSRSGTSPVDLLKFVLYASNPRLAEERLWLGTRDRSWRVPGIGLSTLGEVIGWARPEEFAPRNDRNNRALRALGYEVDLFRDSEVEEDT